MREIKFRGKSYSWHYGDLIHDSCNGRELIFIDNNAERTRHSVDKDTVGQFTGLIDCEGREIYEGDVIASSFADYRAVVEFRNGAFIAVTGPVDTYQALYGVLRLKGLRVIGNVHDNPELLERKP